MQQLQAACGILTKLQATTCCPGAEAKPWLPWSHLWQPGYRTGIPGAVRQLGESTQG